MRKDIEIPEVTQVYIAAVKEEHLEYKTMDWNAYIINDSDDDLAMVLIVSKGYSKSKVTPPMRHQIQLLPARSYAKIEYLQEKVLDLNNEFRISYFKGDSMYDKPYVFKSNTINAKAMQHIPLMNLKGVLRT